MQLNYLMHNWDDLRVFLAVARHKTYEAAAVALGLDATTISRRISRLEQALKCTLAARGPGGCALTAAGRQLLESASTVELANERLMDQVGHSAGGGRVRISTSEGFGATILAPAVPQLLKYKPTIEIEIIANAGFLSPAIREVDLAITLAVPNDKRLVVERLTDYRLGLYASQNYFSERALPKRPDDLRQHVLVGYVDDLLYANELRYLDEVLPDLNLAISSSSIRAQLEIVRAGAGISVLPCFMADSAEPRLIRVLPQCVTITRTFWISARRDVRQTARVRRVQSWIRETIRKQLSLILPN